MCGTHRSNRMLIRGLLSTLRYRSLDPVSGDIESIPGNNDQNPIVTNRYWFSLPSDKAHTFGYVPVRQLISTRIGCYRGGTAKIDRRRSIKGEIDRRPSIEEEKGKRKKGKRRKKKRRRRNTSPARPRRSRVARVPSLPASPRHPR
ncbi:hypothetical protein GW17_00024651 [Ensete ventricosum]|nr:hypothetical protein GW17_00024651 [Ensete ventricosum]RZS12705.1 hypothetical protein BHM03_00044182 [Ensete ventricosum]